MSGSLYLAPTRSEDKLVEDGEEARNGGFKKRVFKPTSAFSWQDSDSDDEVFVWSDTDKHLAAQLVQYFASWELDGRFQVLRLQVTWLRSR